MEHQTVSLFSRELALPALMQMIPFDRVSFILLCSAGLFLFYRLGTIIYNLYFHPLARFPGPFFSRATLWPEFYHDVVRPGLYLYEIQKMHDKYGPVVRVTPDEICIRDSLFYEDLYSHTRRMDNDPRFMKGNGYDGSHFLTIDHDLHKSRRKVLDPFFSRSGVRKIEPLIQELAAHFDTRLRQHAGQVVRMDHAFACFTGDVIRSITCEGLDLLMDDHSYSPTWSEVFVEVISSVPICTAFPWMVSAFGYVPESWLSAMFPKGAGMVTFKNMARRHIVQAKEDKRRADADKTDAPSEQHSVFRSIFNSNMPEAELDTERLTKEAQILFGAGTTTTARTLDLLVYFIISMPSLRQRLADDLREYMAGFPDITMHLSELERLPLLQATIKEGLRVSYGIMHSLPHCYPDTAIRYGSWTIPKNTPVGMSAYFNHIDQEIYPDPHTFSPDRWLGAYDPRMDRAFVPFSRGSRACLGMNLATAEMYFMMATLFRPDGPLMELYNTDETDVRPKHAYMLNLPKMETNGVRVRIRAQAQTWEAAG